MRRSRIRARAIYLVVPVLPLALPPASSAGTGPRPESQPSLPGRSEGYWPSDEMVETLLRRWSASAAQVYALTPAQHEQLRTQLLERWPKFLRENRAELQPLLNEYLEARIAAEAPPEELARRLAHRGLPQLEKLRQFIERGNAEFAALLTDRQRARFDADRSRLAAKLDSLQGRLRSWEQGAYQPQQWWDLTRSPTAPHPKNAPRQAKPAPAHEFDLEMAAWERYVRELIERYGLDDAQRATAASILAEMQARARAHYRTRRVRIAAMEELIRHPQLGTTQAEIEAELIELYGPIDEMFRELDRRLHLIPTEAQQRRAAASKETR